MAFILDQILKLDFKVDTYTNSFGILLSDDFWKDNCYDIAIIDYNLGGVTGGEIASVIRKNCKDTKTVCLTASIFSQEQREKYSKEFDVVIEKPTNFEKFLKLLKRL